MSVSRSQKNLLAESTVQDAVMTLFGARDWFCFPTHDKLHMPAKTGISDVIVVKNGWTGYVECKSEGWKPAGPDAKLSKTEANQRRFRAQIEAHGGIYLIVQTIEQVQSALREMNVYADRMVIRL